MRSFCLLLAAVAAALGCGYNPHRPGPDALDGGDGQGGVQGDAGAPGLAPDGRSAVIEASTLPVDALAADARALAPDALPSLGDAGALARWDAQGGKPWTRTDAGDRVCESGVDPYSDVCGMAAGKKCECVREPQAQPVGALPCLMELATGWRWIVRSAEECALVDAAGGVR